MQVRMAVRERLASEAVQATRDGPRDAGKPDRERTRHCALFGIQHDCSFEFLPSTDDPHIAKSMFVPPRPFVARQNVRMIKGPEKKPGKAPAFDYATVGGPRPCQLCDHITIACFMN